MVVSRSSVRVVEVVVADDDRRRCYEYYKYASSIFFLDAVRSSCCLSDADLIFKGIIFFFVGQWCHGLVGECTPGFSAFGTIPIRFDKIEPVAVIVRFW